MKRSAIKTGRKSIERGTTFAKPRSPLKQSSTLDPGKGPKKARPKKRTPVEQVLAEVWHRIARQKNNGFCVREDCDAPAGEFGHHILEQRTLKRLGLEGHLFDDANSATGLWAGVVAWATDLDARYFPGRQPVLSRLERDYPAVAS